MLNTEEFNEDGLVRSARYRETMEKEVLPALEAARKALWIRGVHGWKLYCERYDAPSPKGTVMIVHGFTSNVYKYSEVIHSLLHCGFSVLIYDQRGHGRSQRDGDIPDLSLTHVDRFGDYVDDLKIVCDTQLRKMPEPHTVFAHSMGGAVTALFLEQHPGVFSRAAMCAPMIAPNRKGIPYGLSMLICRSAVAMGKRKARIMMSKPYAGPEDFETSCSNSRERFGWYDTAKAAHPEFQNNGPTYGWTLESLQVTGKILRPGEPEKIRIPVRIWGAETDYSVLPEPQEQFASRLPDGKRTVVPGSRHEIYRSTDAVFFPWWHEVLCFLGG